MQIQNLRPTAVGATFNVRLTPDIELRDWCLKRTSAGWKTFPPRVRDGRSSICLAEPLHEQITRAARAAMEGAVPNDRTD